MLNFFSRKEETPRATGQAGIRTLAVTNGGTAAVARTTPIPTKAIHGMSPESHPRKALIEAGPERHPGSPKVAGNASPSVETAPAATHITYAKLRFLKDPIESQEALSLIPFHKVINADVKIGQHMYSRIAVARLSESGKECAIFVDQRKSSPDEVSAVIDLVANAGYTVTQGHFAASTIIISLAQGHLNGDLLQRVREIARDPAKNALFQSFTDIIGWAYDNKADDVDFALDVLSDQSQICFKIGGRYIKPPQYLINSDTMTHLLGIAWQRSGGGAGAQFDMKIEQQAQITLDLPAVANSRPKAGRVRLRWSGMANDRGTVVTMRVQRLGQSALVKSLDGAGYGQSHMNIFRRVVRSEGGLVCFSGVVGSGKSTSLAQLLGMLPPYLKIQSIEDPVELEILNAYQKTVARDLLSTGIDAAFLSAARAIYRSALDVLYLGEVRDTETGGVARQVVESGHTVYTTTHARSALGIIDRFVSPQIGIPREVLGAPDILKLLVYQSLLPVNCPHCCKSPGDHAHAHSLKDDALQSHELYWDRIERLYDIGRDTFRLHDPRGCEHCRKDGLPELNGLAGRTVVCEMVEPDDEMVGLILEGRSLAVQQHWRSLADGRFDTDNFTGKTAMECAIFKAGQGLIDPREIEERFTSFETIDIKRKPTRISVASPVAARQRVAA